MFDIEFLYINISLKNKYLFLFFLIFLFNFIIIPFSPYFLDGKVLYSVIYIFPFFFYILVLFIFYSFFNFQSLSFPVPLLLLFLASIILVFIGIYYNNFFLDIFTNFFFFISPFLGFYVSSTLLKYSNNKKDVLNLFILFSCLNIIFFLLFKFFNVLILGQDFVIYKAFNQDGLQSSPLLFVFLFFIFFNFKYKFSILFYFIFSFIFINEILYPFSLPFKQLFISLLVTLIFILRAVYRIQIFKLFLFIIVIGFGLVNLFKSEVYLIVRFSEFFTDLLANSIFKDKRVLEVAGVLITLKSEFPYSILFGHGFGGLWDASLLNVDSSYLKILDYRYESFVSMVHSSYFTILIRSGFFGLLIYLLFFRYIYKKINYSIYNINDDYVMYFLRAYKFYFFLTLFLSFFDYYIYSSAFWGVIAGISSSFYKVKV